MSVDKTIQELTNQAIDYWSNNGSVGLYKYPYNMKVQLDAKTKATSFLKVNKMMGRELATAVVRRYNNDAGVEPLDLPDGEYIILGSHNEQELKTFVNDGLRLALFTKKAANPLAFQRGLDVHEVPTNGDIPDNFVTIMNGKEVKLGPRRYAAFQNGAFVPVQMTHENFQV